MEEREAKKFCFIFFVTLICFNCFILVSAAETNTTPTVSAGYDHNEPLTLYRKISIRPNVSVTYNGEEVLFPDQKAIIENGRTLVPIRGIFEKLGVSVSWDSNANTAIVALETKTIIVPVGKSYITVNEERKPIDVPAKIINGRTMIPLRAVAEALECEVGWDGETYTAIIEN